METINEGPIAATAGAWLRRARQQRGLHIAALAVMLKVPQAKLEAIEADRWSELPDATFARALATAMCRALKVDPTPLLGMLPTGQHALDVSSGLNQPFRDRGGMEHGVVALTRPVVWGPLLLLIAAAAIYWFPASWLSSAAVTPALAPVAAAEPASAVMAALPASGSPVEYISAPLAASVPVLEAASAVASVSVSVALPSPASALDGESLRLSTSAESWVEVIDVRGQVLLQRLLRPGDAQELVGKPPLRLRVGNVAATRIEWRGSAVDLSDRARDKVARLELN